MFPNPLNRQGTYSVAMVDDVRRVSSTVNGLRQTFESGRCRPIEWRLRQLRGIKAMLEDNREAWLLAMETAKRKPRTEADLGDLCVAQAEIDTMIANVASWTKPVECATPLGLMPISTRAESQPYGVTLVIGPCNYPVSLVVAPFAGAIAAGNAVLIKPSEMVPEVAQLLADFARAYLDPDAVQVVLGDASTTAALLEQQFDHIIFTGSPRVGKIVAAAAARYLTPTTLELGGKCPVILHESTEPIESIAEKLTWGRLFNGGQTCVAPEYVLVPRGLTSALAESISKCITKFLGADPSASPDLGRVASSISAQRIANLLSAHGGTLVCGGTVDVNERYIAPTVIVDPKEESLLMNEEVFGPVICLISYETLDGAIAYVNRRPGTPLSLYGFTSDPLVERKLLDGIPSGNALFNDVLIHFLNTNIAFGGLGTSGHGALHGKFYFDACRQQRGVMTKGTSKAVRLLDLQFYLRPAPYNPYLTKAVNLLITKFNFNLPPYYGYKGAVFVVALAVFGMMYSAGLHVLWLRRFAYWVLDVTA